MQNKLDPLWIFLISFVISALAGVAALLRSSQEITARTVMSVILNTGILGLGISMLLFTYFKDNAYFLIGLCVFAGLGGLTFVGFILQVVKQGGIDITVSPKGQTKGAKDGDKTT
jgi:hypothetical protein